MTKAQGRAAGIHGKALAVFAIGEMLTGAALLLFPALVSQLLLGAEPSGVGTTIARVAGIAVLSVGIGSWPGLAAIGALIYSLLVTIYLAYVGVSAGPAGVLLWPAVFLHLVLTPMLAFAALAAGRAGSSRN